MFAEKMAQQMIKRGMKGTQFSRIRPNFPPDLDGIGWYVHMPFCRQMCPYCCFFSLMYSPDKAESYVEAVKKEIDAYRNQLGKIKVGDIYFGGGTPSLTWQGVINIANHIRSRFEVEGEIGLEASLEDINEKTCQQLKNAGISKISLGVQSFDNKMLGFMRRGTDTKSTLKAIELLLSKGFYVSVDLMNCLPGQKISSLINDLETAARTGVNQISNYPLMLFSYTKWYHDVQNGKMAIPDAKMEKEMFYTACDRLSDNGYKQASCWDFVNGGGTGSQYVTCTRDENIGVGLSAYTKLGGLFYVNTFSLKEYIKRVETDLPIATGTVTPPERVMRRWFMMGLYRLRVERADFEKRFGVKIERVLGRFLLMLKLMGLIKEHPTYIEVTRRDMYWVSLMTKTSMLTFPARYYEACMANPWPDDFQI